MEGRSHIPVTACVGPQLEARRTDSDGLATVVHPSSDMDLHSSLGGCYNTRAAPGSGVCREARGGACVMYVEEHSVDGGRHETQGSRAHDDTKRAAAATCTPTTNSDSPNSGECAAGKCDVTIGANKYCSECATAGEVPIDGVCTPKASAENICLKAEGGELDQDKVCGQCANEHFLFKGGCYNVDTAPGNLICSAIDTANTAVCKTCAAGYFKNPANVETSDSCIACGDATGVTVSGGATYKGVANCAAQHCSSKGREW